MKKSLHVLIALCLIGYSPMQAMNRLRAMGQKIKSIFKEDKAPDYDQMYLLDGYELDVIKAKPHSDMRNDEIVVERGASIALESDRLQIADNNAVLDQPVCAPRKIATNHSKQLVMAAITLAAMGAAYISSYVTIINCAAIASDPSASGYTACMGL